MEKKTIGQFMAALRKANGLTQQEVADRLNVSNKAVSRWERDECAPDISVLPALAELLGVTCDELLKGERITNAFQTEKREPKIEKQVKSLINRTLSGFKTMMWISLAVAVVGLVCMFGISYGFYRPVIGFAVMLLFEACAFVIAVLAVNRTKDVKTDNELFENADASLMERFNHCLGTYSFTAFWVILGVIVLSLPLVLVDTGYVKGVLAIQSYFVLFLGGIILIMLLVYLKAKEPYMAWIIDEKCVTTELAESEVLSEEVVKTGTESKSCVRKMNWLQIGAVLLASVILFIAPYFDVHYGTSPLFIGMILLGLGILIANIVVFVVFLIKRKSDRKQVCLFGIRNMLLIPAVLIAQNMHSFAWHHYAGAADWERYDYWYMEYLWMALGWALLVVAIFAVIEALLKKSSK